MTEIYDHQHGEVRRMGEPRVKQTQLFRANDATMFYATTYDHTRWDEHRRRVAAIIEIAQQLSLEPKALIMDLSAGDGAIARALAVEDRQIILGDITPGAHPICGPISETIKVIGDWQVDLFICTETLEHVHDPAELLRQIRRVAKNAIISTPAWPDDSPDWFDDNVEHYWQWNTVALHDMLITAGFTHFECSVLECSWYTYQIWTVK